MYSGSSARAQLVAADHHLRGAQRCSRHTRPVPRHPLHASRDRRGGGPGCGRGRGHRSHPRPHRRRGARLERGHLRGGRLPSRLWRRRPCAGCRSFRLAKPGHVSLLLSLPVTAAMSLLFDWSNSQLRHSRRVCAIASAALGAIAKRIAPNRPVTAPYGGRPLRPYRCPSSVKNFSP